VIYDHGLALLIYSGNQAVISATIGRLIYLAGLISELADDFLRG
jgi:hypothetical protein